MKRHFQFKPKTLQKDENDIEDKAEDGKMVDMRIGELQRRLKNICEAQKVDRLDLFGSRARSGGASGQDYDFVVQFPESSPAEYARNFFGLLHALEDELHSPVDLISYNAIKKQSLRRTIERERIPLYER
jgi:predicted nucleotidyltransferase